MKFVIFLLTIILFESSINVCLGRFIAIEEFPAGTLEDEFKAKNHQSSVEDKTFSKKEMTKTLVLAETVDPSGHKNVFEKKVVENPEKHLRTVETKSVVNGITRDETEVFRNGDLVEKSIRTDENDWPLVTPQELKESKASKETQTDEQKSSSSDLIQSQGEASSSEQKEITKEAEEIKNSNEVSKKVIAEIKAGESGETQDKNVTEEQSEPLIEAKTTDGRVIELNPNDHTWKLKMEESNGVQKEESPKEVEDSEKSKLISENKTHDDDQQKEEKQLSTASFEEPTCKEEDKPWMTILPNELFEPVHEQMEQDSVFASSKPNTFIVEISDIVPAKEEETARSETSQYPATSETDEKGESKGEATVQKDVVKEEEKEETVNAGNKNENLSISKENLDESTKNQAKEENNEEEKELKNEADSVFEPLNLFHQDSKMEGSESGEFNTTSIEFESNPFEEIENLMEKF